MLNKVIKKYCPIKIVKKRKENHRKYTVKLYISL